MKTMTQVPNHFVVLVHTCAMALAMNPARYVLYCGRLDSYSPADDNTLFTACKKLQDQNTRESNNRMYLKRLQLDAVPEYMYECL